MSQVLTRVGSLARWPAVALPTLTVALATSALVALPLFNLPGYELGTAAAIAVGVLGGPIGIAAALRERSLRQRGREALSPFPPEASVASLWLAFLASLILGLAALVPPALISLVVSSISTRCNPFAYFYFYPLLAVPSAVIAVAGGVFSGSATRRWWSALVLYLLLLAASAVWTLWPIYFGPQAYAYNHFGGYFPGPLYDELLKFTPSLLWYRLETLFLAGLLLALASLAWDPQREIFARPHLRLGPFIACVLFGLAIAAVERNSERLRLRTGEAQVALELGGVRASKHFTVIYPRGKTGEEVERLIRDLEFRHRQLTESLGAGPSERIRVYLYRNAEQKQSLVGAGQTQFSKPWRLELHLNDLPFPHPTLKHELAHVMAAPFGSGPFRVTSKLGLPMMALVEGTAVAADNPHQEDLTLHEWSAAMRRQKLAPDVRALFGLQSFYAQEHARAYTIAGSFIRYLIDTYGTDHFRSLYAHGDFQRTYQRSLDELATEWERFLDNLPLDRATVDRAFARFRQGSLFGRACAREVVKLSEIASRVLSSDPSAALTLYRRCTTLQPEEPSFRIAEAMALEKLGRWPEASEVLTQAALRLESRPSLLSEVWMAQADLAWQQGDGNLAASLLQKVIAVYAKPATERAAYIKLAALESRHVGPAIRFFFESSKENLKLLRLREALERDPDNPFVNYLLGRRLAQEGAHGAAVGFLDRSLNGELPRSIRLEAIRLKVAEEYLAGDCAAVKVDVGRVPDLGHAFKAEISEWQWRCTFEEQLFNGPLVPSDPFG
jgi:tetratricopeptide (TPR) repeat protein